MSGRVVVAHETEEIRDAALRVVREAGWEGVGVAEGDSARALILAAPFAAALVVDVGLPRRLGYELVEDLRAANLPTRVVLVASVYSKTAYKRRPSTLYGADDYVEQHHIPDQLAGKLARLIPAPRPVAHRDVHSPHLTPSERREVSRIHDAGEGRLAFEFTTREEALERARGLARLIVADVVLYNGAAVEAGLAAGDLEARLARDLAASREMFVLRVPPAVAGAEDFIGDALREFAHKRRHA